MRTQTKTKLNGKFYECGICDCMDEQPQAEHSPLPTAQDLDQLEMAKEILMLRNKAAALAEALRCALADLQGIMPDYEPSGERTHPGWTTIKEAREALANWEGAKHE